MSYIYLMRHSQAAGSNARTSDDARWLTLQGRQSAREAGAALAAQSAIDYIVTSPLVRAVQTAELVACASGYHGEIHSMASLRAEASAREAIEELEGLEHQNILAVTHEPLVSTMSGLLAPSGPGSRSAFYTTEVRCVRDASICWSWRL